MENANVANVQYKILILGDIRLPPGLLPQPNIKNKIKKLKKHPGLENSIFQLLNYYFVHYLLFFLHLFSFPLRPKSTMPLLLFFLCLCSFQTQIVPLIFFSSLLFLQNQPPHIHDDDKTQININKKLN